MQHVEASGVPSRGGGLDPPTPTSGYKFRAALHSFANVTAKFRSIFTMGLLSAQDGTSDPIITRMVAEDKVPWYKKQNLRKMYFFLFCCCMGVEITSGFDSQLIGTLQFSKPFNTCKTTTTNRLCILY